MHSAAHMLDGLKAPVALVAHDAGAANHIAAWFATRPGVKVFGSFEGPAKEIFARQCPWMENTGLDALPTGCRTLISGTGWASALEHEARKLARQLGWYSIAVIDHWTNYRARFERDGETVLPDEIWVTDEYAEQLAADAFPGIRVVQVHNAYLEGLAREVQEAERVETAPGEVHVLYVLEPIRKAWDESDRAGEFQALDYFMEHIGVLGLQGQVALRLRPHPSDKPGKYDAWMAAHAGSNIRLDEARPLADALAWADVVAGCQTYAMVVALAAGKRVVTTLPPWASMPCALPQADIIRLADLVQPDRTQ